MVCRSGKKRAKAPQSGAKKFPEQEAQKCRKKWSSDGRDAAWSGRGPTMIYNYLNSKCNYLNSIGWIAYDAKAPLPTCQPFCSNFLQVLSFDCEMTSGDPQSAVPQSAHPRTT